MAKEKNTKKDSESKNKIIVNPKWDEDEKDNFLRLMENGTVEGLAYTAVQEAHNARKQTEALEEEKHHIRDAIKKMALGIVQLERILGIDIQQLAQDAMADELEKAFGVGRYAERQQGEDAFEG